MATINYNFTIAGSTGTQLLELVNCSNSSVVTSETVNNSDGNIIGSMNVADNLVSLPTTYKIKLTDGNTVVESSCIQVVCSYAYDLDATGHSNANDACNNSSTNVVVYANESSAINVTQFYTDANLTTNFTGGSGFHRFQKQGVGGSVTGDIGAGGAVNTISVCP